MKTLASLMLRSLTIGCGGPAADSESETVPSPLAKGGKARPLFGQSFNDSFQPYQVHVHATN